MPFRELLSIAAIAAAASSSALSQPDATNSDPKQSYLHMMPFPFDDRPSEVSIATWYWKTSNISNTTTFGVSMPEYAVLQISASVPSVNFENVPEFYSLGCTNTTVLARFNSTENVAKWKQEPTLLIIASHHLCGCKVAREFTMLLATSWMIQNDTHTVLFNTTDPHQSGIKATFKFYALPTGDRNKMLDPSMLPRDPSEWFGFLSDYSFSKSKTVPLNFNSTHAGLLTFQIPNTELAIEASCRSCYIQGSTALKLNAEGSLFPPDADFSVEWLGDISSFNHMMFSVTSNITSLSQAMFATFVEIPVGPVGIPGVFNIGPTLKLRGRLLNGFTVAGRFGVTLGAEMKDFSVKMSTNKGIQTKHIRPHFTTDVVPYTTLDGHIMLSIYPELAFSLDVFAKSLSKPAAARLNLIENNHFWTSNLDGVCVGSDLSSNIEGVFWLHRATIPLTKPYIIARKCNGNVKV